MHSYLKSIGFRNITREQLDELLYEIEKHPDSHEAAINSEENEYVEMRLQVADKMGIAIRGEFNEADEFQMDYYYPYCCGDTVSTDGNIEVIKQSDRECYQAVCDEVKLGVNLIFYLQNMMEYLRHPVKNNDPETYCETKLTGLSLSGKILLPIFKSEKQVKSTKTSNQERSHLLAAARDGDEEAIENLTIEDMDLYSMISKRIVQEDVLSIVSTYFMPYGIESDKYTILGEILHVEKVKNSYSNEEIYLLEVDSNDLVFTVCINEKDLFGVPEVGRRFKGDVWMQGTIDAV